MSCRVCTGHGKPHVSQNFISPEIEVCVMESHKKTINFLSRKVEKTTDKSENQLIPVKK